MLDQLQELIVMFFSDENVRAIITMGSAVFIGVGTKIVAGNIQKQKGLLGNVATFTKDMVSVKTTVDEEKATLNIILDKEKIIEEALAKVNKKEDILVDMFKALVMGTSIDIERKLEIAEMYDNFKRLDIVGDVKNEIKETKSEIIAQVKQHKEDKLTKINAYKQALMETGDTDGNVDNETDKE